MLAGVLALSFVSARADSTWNVSSGNWDVDGNWIGGAPTSADTANIDNSGTALVPGSVSGVYDTLNIGVTGTGSLALTGGLLTGGVTFIGSDSGAVGSALVTSGTWNHLGDLYTGCFNGTGALTIEGGSVNNFNGTIGYFHGTGTATVSGGIWTSSGQLSVGSLYSTGELNISGGQVVSAAAVVGYFNSLGTVNVSSGTWSNTGGILFGQSSDGTGILNLTGGVITGTGGNADVLGQDATSTGIATVTSGTWQNDGNLTVASSGQGTLNLSGGLISDGGATIGENTSGNGLAIVTGGTWNVDGQFIDGYSGTGVLTIADTGVVRIGSGTGALILGGADTGNGTLNIGEGGAAGTLQASEVSGGSSVTGTGAGFVNFNHTGTVNFTPNITGNIAVTEMGPGTTILSGNNTYTGGTTLQDGTLRIEGFSSALGTGILTINGGTLGNEGTDGQTAFDNGVAINSDFAIDVSGTDGVVEMFGDVNLGADATRTITLTGNGLACFGGSISGQNLTLVSASGDSMVMFCSNTSNTFGGTLRVGSGVTLQLDKDPDYTAVAGDAVIDAGATVETWLSEQFSATSNVTVNGTLRQLYSETTTIAALTGTGIITAELTGQTLCVSSGTFAGTITEDVGAEQSLVKQGSGLLVLTGSSSYSGGTVIHSGTLAAGHHSAVGTGQVSVDGGVFLVEASAGGVANTVKLSGGGYNRAFSGTGDLAHAVDASSNFSGGRDTSAAILAGTLSGASMLQTRFATTSSALNDSIRLSDVYSFQGTGTDVFALQLSIADAGPNTYLAWLDTNSNLWVNAVDGNTGNNASLAQQNYAGSFAAFQAAYGTDLSAYIGAYGVDTSAGTTHAWAVVNHNSDFSIVPEPSTWALLGLGALVLGFMARRNKAAARS